MFTETWCRTFLHRYFDCLNTPVAAGGLRDREGTPGTIRPLVRTIDRGGSKGVGSCRRTKVVCPIRVRSTWIQQARPYPSVVGCKCRAIPRLQLTVVDYQLHLTNSYVIRARALKGNTS